MNNIKTFNNDNFRKIKTLIVDNKLWFIDKDVVNILDTLRLEMLWLFILIKTINDSLN